MMAAAVCALDDSELSLIAQKWEAEEVNRTYVCRKGGTACYIWIGLPEECVVH